MGKFLRYCLWSEQDAFLADLRPKYILPYLVKNDVITEEEKAEILSEDIIKRQFLRLIEVLSKKDEKVFDWFVKALKDDDCYPWLAELLLQKKESGNYASELKTAEQMHTALVAGGVPFQTNYFFRRDSLVAEIHEGLKKAAEERRYWVVLYGMIGCGKTVLAAEALRNTHIYSTCFPSGVCWIPIGKLSNNASLKIKMQTFWKVLELSKLHAFSDQEALDTSDDGVLKVRNNFRIALTHDEHKKVLLVLDDVWDGDVIKAFDLGCPVLVTTKDKGIFSNVSQFCTFIKVDDSLTLDETKEFISAYVKVQPSQLPASELAAIYSKCKGLPALLSLAGGLMARWGNSSERWKKLSDDLGKGVTEAFGRTRHSSGNFGVIHKMIKLFMESLDEDLKECYFDLVVFEEDTVIRTKVLEIFWGKDKIEVEDIMSELNQKSLVSFEEDPNRNSYRYTVHDLYLDFLRQECKDIQARHRKLVNNYLELCKTSSGDYNYGLLPDDGYIYFYIGYHLQKANLVDYFEKIFLDFNFIQNKLFCSGPSDLLYDLDSYKMNFGDHIDEVNDIDVFIRRNAHLIAQKDSDIIQLALFEPPESTVYKNAKISALAKSNRIYVECSNQGNVPYRSMLNVKLGLQKLNGTLFSPGGDVVATVGEGDSVVIWDSASGKELEKFTGHTAPVNCCTFNPSGSRLATGSDDKTVRLWEISYAYLSTRRASKTKTWSDSNLQPFDTSKGMFAKSSFTQHEAEVLCCSFSPNSELLVSCDNAGVAYVWGADSGEVEKKICYATELSSGIPINWCSFGCNSQQFALASGSKIHVWNVNAEHELAALEHDDKLVTAFCFYSYDKCLFSAAGSSIWKWDMMSFSHQYVCPCDESYIICCFSLSPDEKFIAAGTSNFLVVVWNVATQKAVMKLKGHKEPVKSISYSYNGSKLLSASTDGHVIVWNLSEYSATSMLSLRSSLSVQYQDELVIATSDDSNRIQVRTGFTGALKCKSLPDSSDITACSLSHDCKEVVYGTKTGAINVFDVITRKTEEYNAHSSEIKYLTHIKNAHGFISCSEDSTMRVWDEQREYRVLKGHSKSVTMCVLYNDQNMLLSCSEDGTLRVWDIVAATQEMVLEGHGNQKVTFCDVSSCEKYLCSASTDKTIKLWDASNGRELKTLRCKDCVRCCRFSPLAGYLISGEDCGRVTMWRNIRKACVSKDLGSHEYWVTDIKFSNDGSHFATVSDSIKLWTKDGHLAQTILLSGASSCVLWASSDFKVFIVIHESVLYILKSIF